MKLQKLLSLTRQAIDKYEMIQENDRIAIGVSGGKDSIALLFSLSNLKRFYPISFELIAITVDLGFGIQNLDEIICLCSKLEIEHHVVKTEIAKVVFDPKFKDSPCSLCSKMRKGALNNLALKLNCNKIAYAHHMDDVVDTFLLSLIYEGRLNTFEPVTHLKKTGLTLIRPFIYIRESEIKGFINKQNLNVLKQSCPIDGTTKREYVKDILKLIGQKNPDIKKKIFKAISTSYLSGWNK